MQASWPRFVVLSALVLTSLLLTTHPSHAVQLVDGPVLTLDPNGETPLAGVVELETDRAVRAKLTITDGDDVWTFGSAEAAQRHYLPVLGLKAERTYTVDVELLPGGRVATLFATTAPLPEDFPDFVTTVSDPSRMEPGYTLVDCMRRDNGDPRSFYSMIVDDAGEVVWYSTRCFQAGYQLPSGNLLFRGRSGDEAVEMDLLGNDRRVRLDFPGIALHHDLLRTPHGTFLSLAFRSVTVPGFPTSDTDPGAPRETETLRDDSIVEFLPDGTLRREWQLSRMLDTDRIGYDSLRTTAHGLDWTHSNAVNYNPADDSIIVSVRHQDAIVQFSRQTGELQWILGPHDNWGSSFQQFLLRPASLPFRWQYHPHAPMWTDAGTLLLFDNGNHRASPFDGTEPVPASENFSRGVEYEVDARGMRVRQIWQYGEDAAERLFSRFMSDADSLEVTGNRLLTFSGVNFVDGTSSLALGMGSSHTRIIETTGDAVPQKVFELHVFDPDGGRVSAYRSQRIGGLYPPTQLDPPNGVGDTLRMTRTSQGPRLSWTASPVDAGHDAAEHYVVYSADSPDAGFGMSESTATLDAGIDDGSTAALTFYKLVAVNSAGTSGDEPAP